MQNLITKLFLCLDEEWGGDTYAEQSKGSELNSVGLKTNKFLENAK